MYVDVHVCARLAQRPQSMLSVFLYHSPYYHYYYCYYSYYYYFETRSLVEAGAH